MFRVSFNDEEEQFASASFHSCIDSSVKPPGIPLVLPECVRPSCCESLLNKKLSIDLFCMFLSRVLLLTSGSEAFNIGEKVEWHPDKEQLSTIAGSIFELNMFSAVEHSVVVLSFEASLSSL